MKKLLFLVSFVSSLSFGWTFFGFQSLNGLQTTKIFTASNAGIYFVNGTLYLPQLVTTGGVSYSQAVATIDKNGAYVYATLPGQNGFQLNQISMSHNDYITVTVSSTSASVDGGFNAVSGQVSYGNTF